MSINDDILSRGLKERALLSLYEKKLDTDLTKVMSSHKKRLVNSAIKNGNKSVNALNRALTLETRKTYRKIYRNGISELKALANTSSKFHNSTLKQSLGKVYRSKVYTGLKVNDLIINSAGTYSEQIASISLSQQRRIKDVVKKGMIENLAVNKIAKNVGSSIDLPSAQLKTLSRTAITETSSNVSNATYKLNEDVIDGYQYVATLDSRTSLICGRLDGKVFRLDDNRGVRPPQHFNCRSTTVPIVKSYEDLRDTKSSRISKRRLQRISKSKRASFDGQVPSEINYEKFLSQQDDNFKLAVLGNKRRVEIYNTGKLKFTQFSTRDGQLVSVGRLEELLNGVKVKPIVKVSPKPVVTKVVSKPGRAFNSNTTFAYNDDLNISEINKKLDALEGQKEVNAKIAEFIESKKLSIMYIPRSFGRRAVRDKHYDNMSDMYKKNNNGDDLYDVHPKLRPDNKKERPGSHYHMASFTSIPRNMNGFTQLRVTVPGDRKLDNFIGVVIDDKNANFKNVNTVNIQQGTKNALQDAFDNAGPRTRRYKDGSSFNLNWSISSMQKTDVDTKFVTTLHELGHQVHYYAVKNGFRKDMFDKLTIYGTSKPEEYYAELFAAYATNRNELKRLYPDLAKLMDNMLDDAVKSNKKVQLNMFGEKYVD